MKPAIAGLLVFDKSRPELGSGVLNKWYMKPHNGKLYASVRFSCGYRSVCQDVLRRKYKQREKQVADDLPFSDDEIAHAKRYGLTPRQYRSAMR